MDPLIASLILFAGLVLMAAVMTTLAVTRTPGSLPKQPKAEGPVTALPVTIFCPQREAMARVGIGLDRGGRGAELTVLQCEHFPYGPIACDLECLGASIAA